MFDACPQQLSPKLRFRFSQGKSLNKYCCKRLASGFATILLLGFASIGFGDDSFMVSVPLGFEISGFDRSRNWVSESGVFAFGFLEKDSDNYDGFLVGIRYNLGTKADDIPVWTVGGGLGVSMNSTFRLSMDGRLVLLENPNGVIVWSSNTSNLGVQKATLLNNGNLVLMGIKDEVIWESFSKPTSTLLPGQSLNFSQSLRAPSTKSVLSYYSLLIRRSGELALMWENNVTYWKSHQSSSSIIKEARFDDKGVLGLYDDTNKVVWFVSSNDFGDPHVVLRHLRIDSDGNLRIYYWDNELHTWRVGWQAVENQCEVFGYCGLYSICGYNSTEPLCECLYSDNLGFGVPTTDSSSCGCRQMVDLGNCKMHTSMSIMKQTVLYGLYPPLDVELMLSENACKEYCSNDTACIAVTSKNDGSGLCTIKRTSFVSGYRSPSVQATSFLKVCLVPQAVAARGQTLHGNAESVPKTPNRFMAGRSSCKKFIGATVSIVLMTILLILALQFVVVWYIYRRSKVEARIRIPLGKDAQMNTHYSFLIRLSFEEIRELTNNFANQIGPTTFKGVLPNKVQIIAKVLNGVIVSEKDFRVGVFTLGGIHHRNLVPLKGFCFESKHKLLLYEYIPLGSLNKWLFDAKCDKNGENWQQRLDIALGVARGLAYLHSECQQCIAHGNLKVDNVLLDEKLVPKLTNFGIRSLLEKDVASSSESLPERDIYMLGEMLLQIVTCKRDGWGDDLHDVIDKLKGGDKFDCSEEWKVGIERVVRIALWCMQSQPFLRPSIGEVVKVLGGTLSVDYPPSGRTRESNETMK